MTFEIEHKSPGELLADVCPVGGCENTEDLWVMECAPGYTWTFVNGCGHWGFIYRKTDDVPHETKE
jgi:hypothetical protein